jgi:hypothetical protein
MDNKDTANFVGHCNEAFKILPASPVVKVHENFRLHDVCELVSRLDF